ncbi:hypothetical protein FLA105534_04787 [Flavobacterium bizetiae]|uniref:Uncharacterized protein n=1 Tax=Flavobacterium bizetiae TaxID=2704140 RepID=A0A6J4GXI0_9FLAO|nr:hypothetical protein FLA105534_04787 [Flavobacterium bizetiae]CAD5344471.1 hypothetical protein FLA105535_04477 [Flavobacterium bizetiae]CAD5350305.1 hypothetical protein FLA105534_04295 [Flavobacterium bizetiae]
MLFRVYINYETKQRPDRSDMADLDNDRAKILSVPAKYINLEELT